MTPRQRLWLIAMALAGVAIAPAEIESADERGDSSTVVRTEEGLRFRLPADWPVEKRGSVVAPIPVEEYLSRKFSVLDARLRSLEQQLAAFDLRLRVVEEHLKDQNRLRSTEPQSNP